MSLLNVFQSSVKVMSKIFDSVKGDVVFRAWVGQTGGGEDKFADPVTLRGVIAVNQEVTRTSEGQLAVTLATIEFLDPIPDTAPMPGQERKQPIDPRDSLVLPDGSTAPIIKVGGPLDPSTSRGFVQAVTLGTIVRS